MCLSNAPTKTIAEFCENNGIETTTYYDLRKAGRGPREMRNGGKVSISPEAELDWRREMEKQTEQQHAIDAKLRARAIDAARSDNHDSKRRRA